MPIESIQFASYRHRSCVEAEVEPAVFDDSECLRLGHIDVVDHVLVGELLCFGTDDFTL